MTMKRLSWLSGLLLASAWTLTLADPTPHEQAFAAYQRADYAEAYRIWEGLAREGDSGAQYALGVMFYQGEGRAPDRNAGIEWFEKAAHSGLPIAMFNLGAAHWEAQRYDLAVQWWQKAADLSDAISQYNLGLAYRLGRGVAKDLKLALHWVQASAQNGYEGAVTLLPTLEEEYQRMELAAAASAPPALAPAAEEPQPSDQQQVAGAADAASALDEGMQVGFIAEERTAVFATHASDAPVIATLESGTPVKVVSVSEGWAQVQQAGGFILWVAEKFVTEQDGEARINAHSVRARPLPSTDPSSVPVGMFEQGDRVVVLVHQGVWKQVRAPEHLAGWVSAERVEILDVVSDSWREKWNAGR